MAENYKTTLLSISWMGVDFITKAELILSHFGGIAQDDELILFGVIWMNSDELELE